MINYCICLQIYQFLVWNELVIIAFVIQNMIKYNSDKCVIVKNYVNNYVDNRIKMFIT